MERVKGTAFLRVEGGHWELARQDREYSSIHSPSGCAEPVLPKEVEERNNDWGAWCPGDSKRKPENLHRKVSLKHFRGLKRWPAPSGKLFFPRKFEDLRSVPRIHMKRPGIGSYSYDPRSQRGSKASQSRLLSELQAIVGRGSSKNTVDDA